MSDLIRICLPVFAVVGLGYVLRRQNFMCAHGQAFIAALTYHFCLPLLVFCEIVRQDFGELVNVSVIGTTLIVTAVTAAAYWAMASAKRVPGEVRGPFAFSPYFGNVAFLGFPLASSAFGDQGLACAAIINAFAMPVFIMLGLIALSRFQDEKQPWHTQVRSVLLNPIILAALLGLVFSLLWHEAGMDGLAREGSAAGIALRILGDIANMLKSMGLPLALLAVGASLHRELSSLRPIILAICLAGKLVITPLLTLLVGLYCFGMSGTFLGTSILIMAMPTSVAATIMAGRSERTAPFAAAMLVISTILSFATLPLWIWVGLRL